MMLTAVAALCLPVAGSANERFPALAPEEALERFQLEPGLRIELVAAEPLVVDPVAFAFDGPRRLYVVEGRAYPDLIIGDNTSKEGRIALLEDTDGDGRFDRRTEFATGLGFANGIAAWRGGFFVTVAPDILYLKDNNGDGVADERRVVLTGFDATKSTQIRVSHPTLGFDGRMYVTSGLTSGNVTSPQHPERPAVSFSPRDGRFDPDSFLFESTGGRGQFGLTFDGFGRRFICENRHPVLQVMLEPWQLRRNPYLAFSDTTQEVSKAGAEARVFPISRASVAADFNARFMAAPHSGTFTAACGVLVFGGTGLTPEHVGNVFICEPAQNLVQRQVFRAAGASFRSDPPYTGSEFLASSDVWFRPVFLGNSPDGALYIADMYRREIDHPVIFPEDARGRLDFAGGKDRGRIYRIVRDEPRRERGPDVREGSSVDALIHGLKSSDEWWRAHAHRLLVERRDHTAVPPLEKSAVSARLPESRVRALWALHGLRALSIPTLRGGMRDADPRVREQAVQLAAEMLPQAPELLAPLLVGAQDGDARVRFASALALAAVDDARAVPALAAIAIRDGEDRWTRAAVLTGIGSRMTAFLSALEAARTRKASKAFALMMEDLGRVYGAGAKPEDCRDFLVRMIAGEGELSWRLSSVLGLARGLGERADGSARAAKSPFAVLLEGAKGDPKSAALQAFLRAAAEHAADDRAPTAGRVSAVSLLGYTDIELAGPALSKLLDARQPPELQLQAVGAIERLGDARSGALLTGRENWSRYTPQIRAAVIAALTSKPQFIGVLFDAIERGVIAAPEIPPMQRSRLLKHSNPVVRQKADAVFKQIEGGDRMQVYRTYRETLSLSGDLAGGREVFLRVCSACHAYDGIGGNVGPDLTGVRNQPADALLLHTLVPNYEVAPSYHTLSIVTHDGRSISGWLAGETETSLTLRTAFGTEETVLRNSILSLNTSSVSLMPDGLEHAMTKEELSSLIAYLKSPR